MLGFEEFGLPILRAFLVIILMTLIFDVYDKIVKKKRKANPYFRTIDP